MMAQAKGGRMGGWDMAQSVAEAPARFFRCGAAERLAQNLMMKEPERIKL